MNFANLYLSPKGRISRKTWWLGTLGLIVIAIIAQVVIGMIGAIFGLHKTTFGVGLISLISMAVLFVPYYALTTKRLHDRGRPEWFFWAFLGPTIAYSALVMIGVAGSMEEIEMFGQKTLTLKPNALGQATSVAAFAVGLWALIELGFLKGHTGENAHGPDPLARAF